MTGRNSPTVINSVFNYRNFWDGRADNEFNGVDPFGWRNPDAAVIRHTPGGVVYERVRLENSSAASQAVGPPNSSVEMAWNGRTFQEIGKKLLPGCGACLPGARTSARPPRDSAAAPRRPRHSAAAPPRARP